ncbi:MAG: NAD-dependent epimerase/dehydratase family protein [Gemmatimonadaceae bacterium]|nr:NAD-dependent epimerase/dehydratase family protein [Gemmatimonadaceae bacterium]
MTAAGAGHGAPRDRLVIAVTGATGFVGRQLLADGARAGHRMVAVTRSPDAIGEVEARGITDLDDRDGLSRALAGADAVVHLAARVHVMHHEGPEALERFRAVNVRGTRHLLEAARDVGVGRVVLLSTAKVLGEGARGELLRDTAAPAPVGAYATSKAEMESLLDEPALAPRQWAVLRPPLVHGPGVGGNFRRLLQLADLGARIPLPFGGVRNARSLVGVRNLADAILCVLTDARAHGGRFLVSDGEDPSTADLLLRLGRALGRRVRLVNVPPLALQAGLRLIGRGAEAERLLGSFRVEASALRTAIGWRPPLSVDAGLEDVAAWWCERGGGR